MITHILFVFLIFFMNIRAKLGKKTRLTLTCWVLFFFCALRYEFGNDYKSYYKHFNNIKDGYHIFKREITYQWLNEIFPSFYLMIAVISGIMLFVMYKMIVKYVDKKYYGLAVAIWLINPYLFLVSLSAIRQTIACLCFIMAIVCAYKKKIVPYVFWILFATTFHTSALFLLPVYFIANDKRIHRRTIVVYCIVIFALVLSDGYFMGIIDNMIDVVDSGQYYYYVMEDNQNSLRATLLSFIYFLYIAMNISKLRGTTLMSAKLYMLGLSCSLLAYQLSMMTRWQQYFDVYSLVAIPGIISYNLEHKKEEKNRLLRILNIYIFPTLIFAIYILRYYSFFTNPTWESFWKYRTILEVIM